MRSRYAHIFTVVVAALAFVPVLAVDYMLDGYVKARETGKLQAAVDAVTHDSQRTVQNAIQSLRRIVAESPSLCTTTFFSNVNREIQQSLYLKQVVVENRDGIAYCAAFDGALEYRVLSESITIPGHVETLRAVSLEGFALPVLKITQSAGPDRSVSAFVVAAPLVARPSASLLGDADSIQIALANGTPIFSRGDDAGPASRRPDMLVARSFAGEIPLRAEAGISFERVRADYAQLDIGFTLVACLMGIVMLTLALQYVRRSNMPAFDLERAIAAGELKPYYQPVFNLRTGRLTGCEVLARWVRRNGEIVPPGAFIDYAEMTGLAIPMTLSLMEQVRNDLADLCRAAPDFKVSINLFEGHFRDGSIVEDIQSIFGDSGIGYHQLVFEITERRPLDNRAAVERVVSAMHKLGVRIAMDDAGTGHSNLAYLQTLGIDIIKIDRIFVEMIKDGAPAPVIDGLIAMAHDMEIEIVAEGVETQEQAVYLRSRGVVYAQGYLFARPMKLSAFLPLAYALKPKPRTSNLDDDIAA